MKNEFTFLSSDQQTDIHVIEWIPEGKVRAVLQISHGMVEHIARYEAFAEYLNQSGFVVVGNDHLGHGASVTDDDKHGYFCHPDGDDKLIADLHTLRRITKEKYPEVPYFMLGHSFGSFVMRRYISEHGKGLAGVVIMGTGSQSGVVLKIGKTVCRLLSHKLGWHGRSVLMQAMAFSSYNKKIHSPRTDSDWLTKDTEVVDRYLSDPWCSFIFTLDGFYQMFRIIEFIQKPKNISRIPSELPIFLVSGTEDPVGAYGKDVQKVYRTLQKYGKNVRMKLYPDDRHEILNETDCRVVYRDILHWMTAEENQ